MDCERVRELLKTPLKNVDSKELEEANKHLLKCNACFMWVFNECEKIRERERYE